MSGVAGATVAGGSKINDNPADLVDMVVTNIAPAQALLDGDGVDASGDPIATSRGCTTNFIGFGKGLTSQEPLPEDFNATDDTVTEANSLGQSFAPTYTAVPGNALAKTLSWVDTTP